MRDYKTYDYAIVRVVPRVERAEFVNAGVILSCPHLRFLEARIELDEARLLMLYPGVNLPLVKQHLFAIPSICEGGAAAGPIGLLSQRERFHWLVAPRSTMIQTSPVHSGCCEAPQQVLAHLIETMVRPAT